MREMALDIAGMGIILYSPYAVSHISEGADYFASDFTTGEDVARHVMACELTGFCTGSPGSYRLRFTECPLDEEVLQAAAFKLRLGLWVQDETICVRDLFDLIYWSAHCPPEQQLCVSDGWYRLTVFSSRPPSGIMGDNQVININLEATLEKPRLRWEGIPTLCEFEDR